MSEEEEHLFQQSNSCWICKKLIDNDKENARDHCHITGKFRGAAHWNCNINFQLIFHNLREYVSHLIFNEFDKFDRNLNQCYTKLVRKIHGIFLNKNLVFIDSMQFMNSNLDKIVKNMSDKDFKY